MKTMPYNATQKNPDLSIRLLGEPHIYLRGKEVIHFQYRKSVALLAFLATTQKVYSREFLADLLWGTLTEKNAQAALRKTLADINNTLSEYLLIEKHYVALNFDKIIHNDAFLFEQVLLSIREKNIQTLSTAEITRLEEALDSYQGRFMNGFSVRNAPQFEDWLSIQGEYLQTLQLGGLQIISAVKSRIGQFQEAIHYLRRLLVIEPTSEEAHYKLMSLLALNGQRTLALNQFEICKRTLLKAYDSLPQQKTIELYKRIISESENLTRNKTLPLPITPIHGRDEEISNIYNRLQDDRCRILTIMGTGGIGKTHLALMIGHEVNHQPDSFFEDGAVFVSLQALQSIQTLSSSIAHQFGYSYDKESDPVQQLCDFLSPFKMLLILDNFEQLMPSLLAFEGERYEFLHRILHAAPGVKLLITSRIRLNFQGEFIYPLSGIAYPQDENTGIEEIRQYPAVALFLQRAEQLIGSYQPNERDMKAIVDICRRVNGLPLGILLAAGWINLLSAKEIAEHLLQEKREKGQVFLATGGSDMPERHRDMDSVFRQSWQMISSAQQEALSVLSILPSGFSLETARHVAQIDITDFRILIDHSLVEKNHTERFQIHNLLRQYAIQHDMHRTESWECICQYFAKKVAGWEQAIKGSGQVQAIHEMNLEIDNLRAIWAQIVAQENYVCAKRMFEGLCLYYSWRHFYGEAFDFCEKLVQRLQAKHEFDDAFTIEDTYQLMAKALTWQASFTELRQAGKYVSKSLEILDDTVLQHCDTREERAFATYWMANSLAHHGNHDEAFRLLDECKTLYESLQDKWHLKDVFRTNGILLWDKSAYRDSQVMMEQALTISRNIGDRQGMAHAMMWLGNTTLFRGDQAGESMVRESLSIFSELGDQMGGLKGKIQACSSLYMLGMYKEGCELLQNSITKDVFEFYQDTSNVIYAIGLIQTGYYEKARIFIQKGLVFVCELGDDYMIGLARITQAWLYIKDGLYDLGGKTLLESVQHADRHNIKELQSWSLSYLAINNILMGKKEEILYIIQDAVNIALEINSYVSKVLVIASIALWFSINDNPLKGYSFYTFVRQHEFISNSVWWQDCVTTEIERISANLKGGEMKKKKNHFTGMTLDEVVSVVLDELKTARGNALAV